MKPILDTRQRPLRDLRISVTDRCNFRCYYCMPPDRDYSFLPKQKVLSFEEIAAVVKVLVPLGVSRLRLTGGEPLVRRDLHLLVEMLSAIPGIEDIALTTNGYKLKGLAPVLKEAGLHRLTVSLDSLKADRFRELSGGRGDLTSTLAGLRAASKAGFPIKLNAVIRKQTNEDEIIDLVRFARDEGYELRFIEFMDVGTLNGWNTEHVVSRDEILKAVAEVFPFESLPTDLEGKTADRFRFLDGQGRFGVIASVTRPFCGGCTRARLSADGQLYTCLFAAAGHDLKTPLREFGPDRVAALVSGIWRGREDRYSELRGQGLAPDRKVEMYHIGG